MSSKHYITAQQLLDDAYALGLQVFDSGFRPDLVVGVWRGGTPVAIAVHELLDYLGVSTDHIPVRTSLYRGIDDRNSEVVIEGLDYLQRKLRCLSPQVERVLVVDDVFDTGLSLDGLLRQLRSVRDSTEDGVTGAPEIRIAALWTKPANHRTALRPDYYLHETSAWLVFPHELCGLSRREILSDKPGIDTVRGRLAAGGAKVS